MSLLSVDREPQVTGNTIEDIKDRLQVVVIVCNKSCVISVQQLPNKEGADFGFGFETRQVEDFAHPGADVHTFCKMLVGEFKNC